MFRVIITYILITLKAEKWDTLGIYAGDKGVLRRTSCKEWYKAVEVGRPPTAWTDHIKKYTGLSMVTAKRLVEDRARWWNLVKATAAPMGMMGATWLRERYTLASFLATWVVSPINNGFPHSTLQNCCFDVANVHCFCQVLSLSWEWWCTLNVNVCQPGPIFPCFGIQCTIFETIFFTFTYLLAYLQKGWHFQHLRCTVLFCILFLLNLLDIFHFYWFLLWYVTWHPHVKLWYWTLELLSMRSALGWSQL